jgi:hypothetical protein
MNGHRLLLLLSIVGAPACWSTFQPGRCDQTSDCGPGLVCNLDPTPQGDGRCVSPGDGSVPDSAGGSGEGGRGHDAGLDAAGTGGSATAGQDGAAGAAGADAHDGPEVKPGCTVSTDCPATTPVCDAGGACRRCDANTVSSDACSTVDASKPTCGPDGQCIVCASSADCKSDPTKPICDIANQKCVACTSDSQCVDKLGANPGVCMAHQDGRCATDAETFYVSNQTGCDDSGVGSATTPFCALEPAAAQASASRDLIVVRGAVLAPTSPVGGASEISIVGQQAGSIASAVAQSALHLASGLKLYARNVTISAGLNGVGIAADSASVLRLDHGTVSNSGKGGISLAGAAFDISNSTITGNGPGSDGALFWGGIYVQFPPQAGPARLNLVSVANNKSSGISCTGPITGIDVLATGNGGDITTTCGFISCAGPGPMCGTQP